MHLRPGLERRRGIIPGQLAVHAGRVCRPSRPAQGIPSQRRIRLGTTPQDEVPALVLRVVRARVPLRHDVLTAVKPPACRCVDTNAAGWEKLKVTISLGLAHYPKNGDKPESLLAAADKALYAAKDAGRNRVVDS